MKCREVLFVCWCFSVLTGSKSIKVEGFSCVSDYWHEIKCVLNIPGAPVGSSNYTLRFTERFCTPSTCQLKPENDGYGCVVDIDPLCFSSEAFFTIRLFNESRELLITNSFNPSRNIQPKPPHTPVVEQTPEGFNITWKSGYEEHLYLDSQLEYQLLLHSSQGNKNNSLDLFKKFELIDRSQLMPGVAYCIRVRSKPSRPNYDGIWSEWSNQTCWKTEAREEQENILVILCKSLGPVCLVVGVLLFVVYNPAARMKIKTLSHTPSPAPFFQPLFQQYDGNLKEWISPQGKYVLKYKTEEILTMEAVVIMPKPITKDPEEDQDLQNPPVIPVAFTQCQSSYVGLPGMHEPPPPLPVICPGNTSYTQLPCAVWRFGVGEEVEVEVCSSPKDFFDLSTADSGCSCENSTESPECCLPASPDNDPPPPCYCDDYCILNKTENGITPVLVSKETRPSECLWEKS